MKKLKAGLLILIILALCYLAACTPVGSISGKPGCSTRGEVCIRVSTVQSFSVADPVVLNITVTSSKDLPELNGMLDTGAEITIDGPQTWENYTSNQSIDRGHAYWKFAIKANQSLTFNRVLHFPSHEGYFHIIAEVATTGRILQAADSFYIHITSNGGSVIRAGTPFPPFTPNATLPVYGPGTPVPTFCCATDTPVPSRATTPTPTQSVPLVSTSTAPPYPPPTSYL